jgi:septation ring formation regulator EzrA
MYYIIAVVVIAVLVVGYLVYRNNQTKIDAVVAKVKSDLAAAEVKAKTGG